MISNVNKADINVPQYVKLQNQTINNFNIEYTADLEDQTLLKGNIISTLHFRKLNGF